MSQLSDTELLAEVCSRFSSAQIIEAYQERQRAALKIPVSRRLGLFPISDDFGFEAFKRQLANFWTAEEAKWDFDQAAFASLKPEEQHFLKLLLAIFSFQDGDVIEGLLFNYLIETPTVEGKVYFLAQALMEAIHAWSYSLQIQKITFSQAERDEMISAVDRLQFLKRKEDLNHKYKTGKYTLAERYVASGCLEGISFSTLFAGIFSFRVRKPYPSLDGLLWSNEKIAADEAIHRDVFIGYTKQHLAAGDITAERVLEIVQEFLELELETVDELLPVDLDMLTRVELKNYVRFVADSFLHGCGCPKIWKGENPLEYMNLIGMTRLTNFFEKKVGEYSAMVEAPVVTAIDAETLDEFF